jgi:hypothetical protein
LILRDETFKKKLVFPKAVITDILTDGAGNEKGVL